MDAYEQGKGNSFNFRREMKVRKKYERREKVTGNGPKAS